MKGLFYLAEKIKELLPDEDLYSIISWLTDESIDDGDPIELAQYYLDDKTEVQS